MKTYSRYVVKFTQFKNKICASVLDNYWDSHDYAFFFPGEDTCTSYSDVAATYVQAVLNRATQLFSLAAPDTCFQILTNGVHGKVVGVQPVPMSYFSR